MQHFSCRTASALIDIYVLLFIPFEGSVGQDQLAAQLMSAQETENRRRTAIPTACRAPLSALWTHAFSILPKSMAAIIICRDCCFLRADHDGRGRHRAHFSDGIFISKNAIRHLYYCRGIGVLESESTYFNIYENL